MELGKPVHEALDDEINLQFACSASLKYSLRRFSEIETLKAVMPRRLRLAVTSIQGAHPAQVLDLRTFLVRPVVVNLPSRVCSRLGARYFRGSFPSLLTQSNSGNEVDAVS